jgi:DNA-binding MarR family transcriptional regulator
MPSHRRTRSFERKRQLGFGRLLLMARRDFVARLNQRLAESGEQVFQSMQIASYLDSEGTRSIEIARRMGVTKQAVGAMVRELEAASLVVQTPDPDDGRATLVSFTDEGLRYMRHMHVLVRKIEREYAALIGAETFEAIREGLEVIAYRDQRDAAPIRKRRQGA